MVAAQLIHRDFSDIVQQFGDTVNTRRPGEFVAKRKGNADEVTIQDATATNVAVKLNQWVYTSFMIKDGEESKAFKDLVAEYMAPAMLAQARHVDQVILGQYAQFLENNFGSLGGLTPSTAKTYILGTRNVMNKNKAYMQNRNLILTPNSETSILGLDLFLAAQDVGDNGTALQEAALGRKLAFDMYMAQNMATVLTGNTTSLGALNEAGSVGETVLDVDGFTGAVSTGGWLTIAGDDTPYRVAAHTETLGNTTQITLHTGLRYAVLDNAVVTFYVPGAINFVAGYDEGYDKEIVVDGFTVAPQVGQLVSFTNDNATSPIYTIIGVTGLVGITLDRPLEADIANNDEVNIGPAGEYNLAFHRNAMTMVIRPLAAPKEGTGARSTVVNYNGLSMRATITYDGRKQGHLVTLDMLFGIKVLDENLAAVMFG